MYITVRLLTNFQKPLTYCVPQNLQKYIHKGVLVQVPLQARVIPAVVVDFAWEKKYSFKVRDIDSIFPFPQDATYARFIEQLSAYHQIESLYFLKRLKQFLSQKEIDLEEVELSCHEEVSNQAVTLTDEQKKVVADVKNDIVSQKHKVTLLHGVTGSGKTEVYKKLFQHVVADGQVAMLLLPEVTLSLQFETLLRQQMPGITILGFHSSTSVKQKKILWQHLLDGRPCIIVGVHLPVLLPIHNLGIIIVDEEHEAGYQEKKHPKIQTKNAAIMKAAVHSVPIVLGSATPSITSLANVDAKGWRLSKMHNRFAGNFPRVQVVSLQDKKERKNFWISQKLLQAIRNQLERKEQTIVFLNRRGFSFFVQCKSCSFIFSCSNCSISLTLHGDNKLLCHYCGFADSLGQACPDCKCNNFLKKGIGTQQVVTILERLFPQAVIARADLDTTSKKKQWKQTMQDFKDQKIDILVGTQSITKGYHFPHVTLVGVLWADLNLHFPMYNAAETTLQQLIQVAGRAGRQSQDSLVIVQTMTKHPIFSYLEEKKYLDFYEYELKKRKEIGYPPAMHIAEIEMRNTDQFVLEKEADRLVDLLDDKADDILVLGPVPAVVYKVQRTFSQKIFLKHNNRKKMMNLYGQIHHQNFASSLFFMIDPIS